MPSEASSGPTALSRYRPALYLLTGVAAAYSIYTIHSYLATPAQPPSSTSLRRRNAVRRSQAAGGGARRRRSSAVSGIAVRADNNAILAISHLEQLERQDAPYGTFRIEVEDGRRIESGLLPRQLASVEQLQQEVGVTLDNAISMREMMEHTFLDSFLALEFPPVHEILRDTGEWDYLREELRNRGLSEANIDAAFQRFNNDDNFGESLRRRRQNGERVVLATDRGEGLTEELPTVQVADGETVIDEQSVFSWQDGNNDSGPSPEGQNLLNLLYHIAEDQARRDGYIHRGVTCNSCGAMPIQGIRYRCANCIDYDLCETCEALQVHIKTHLFYKVRIPAPFLGNPRQSQPVWYPGKPMMLPRSLPRPLAKRLMKETNFENTELDALWDQFRCLANVEWPTDPNKLNMAIDRKTFDRCFVPNTSARPPPPSLIYDRMFAFYDTNGDNLIGFEEFLRGLASFNNKSLHERLRRIFDGYDIDRDGYVDRRDFLRMFRAYYALSRELTRDMVAGMEDDFLEGGARDVVLGSQPISSAFPGSIPSGEPSRLGEGKRTNLEGDMVIIDNDGILREDGDERCDRNQIIGDAAARDTFGRARPVFPSTVRLPHRRRPTIDGSDSETESERDGTRDGEGSESSFGSDQWPPTEQILDEDIVRALGSYVPLSEITDRVDRARIGTAVYRRMRDEDQMHVEDVRREGIGERWRRRAFYIDEEDGATAPPGFDDESESDGVDYGKEAMADGGEGDTDSRPPSPRSRSSSKVRFQDDVTDNEYDARSMRSNQSTSSRSIPVGERWGGFEVPEVERDAGKEILYQVTQQGLNELLDIIFKPKEDLIMEAYRTRDERKRWAKEIEAFESVDPKKKPAQLTEARKETIANLNILLGRTDPSERPLEQLLDEAGYTAEAETPTQTTHEPTGAPQEPEEATMFSEAIKEEPEQEQEVAMTTEENEQSMENGQPAPSKIDPTLPHNRPDEVLEPFPLAPVHLDEAEVEAEAEDTEDDSSLFVSPDMPDPTLPHNRPNTPDLISVSQPDEASLSPSPVQTYAVSVSPVPSLMPTSPSRQDDTEPSRREPARLRFDFNAVADSSSAYGASNSTANIGTGTVPGATTTLAPPTHASATSPTSSAGAASIVRPPSPKTLARYSLLNSVEDEARERGGAKLNFEEFGVKMQGDRGRRLGFVGSWIEMASF